MFQLCLLPFLFLPSILTDYRQLHGFVIQRKRIKVIRFLPLAQVEVVALNLGDAAESRLACGACQTMCE